jgi:hypothetical protein
MPRSVSSEAGRGGFRLNLQRSGHLKHVSARTRCSKAIYHLVNLADKPTPCAILLGIQHPFKRYNHRYTWPPVATCICFRQGNTASTWLTDQPPAPFAAASIRAISRPEQTQPESSQLAT